jgi:hypothetical protein
VSSTFIIVGPHVTVVAVDNLKPSAVPMETHKWVLHKSLQYKISQHIRPVGTKLICGQTEGQTLKSQNAIFAIYENAPKKANNYDF